MSLLARYVFTVQHYTSTVYAVVVCLSACVSVCLSVTLWHCFKTAKHRIAKIMHTLAPGLYSFLAPKITTKIELDDSQTNASGVG